VGDTNRTLWGGFVVDAGGVRFYHAGDSGCFSGFAEIGRRLPGILAAMIPIGSYAPGWFMEPNHMTPEQAGRAFLDVGARALVPMHWGTFRLTDEPLREPVERLQAWWTAARLDPQLSLRVPAVGETLVWEDR
jgi:L-ascorbate metabolism protein UlaG (beta-lactamase superfamily)